MRCSLHMGRRADGVKVTHEQSRASAVDRSRPQARGAQGREAGEKAASQETAIDAGGARGALDDLVNEAKGGGGQAWVAALGHEPGDHHIRKEERFRKRIAARLRAGGAFSVFQAPLEGTKEARTKAVIVAQQLGARVGGGCVVLGRCDIFAIHVLARRAAPWLAIGLGHLRRSDDADSEEARSSYVRRCRISQKQARVPTQARHWHAVWPAEL